MPLPLYCSPKHSGVLLGSNSMRNTIAIATSMRQRHLFDPAFFHAESLFICQEKPTCESLAILFIHATMIV